MSETKAGKITATQDGRLIHFDVAGAGRVTLDLAAVSTENQDYAVFHGFKQRIVDSAALERGAGPEAKLAEMARLVEHYNSGSSEWNVTRTGGGGGGQEALVVLALKRVYGDRSGEPDVERLMAKRGIDRKAALKVWAGTDKVAAAMAAIQAERAAQKASAAAVDADDLLAELDA